MNQRGNKTRAAVAAALLTVGCMTANAKVVTYPAGKDVPTIHDFAIEVRQDDAAGRWENVDAYPVTFQEVKLEDGVVKRKDQTASYAYFDFDGRVQVRVVSAKPVRSVRVRPLSYGIKPEVKGDTICFTLDRARNLSVEVNGDIFHNLHLFANPLDSHRPTDKEIKKALKNKKGNLLYFGPGIHKFPGDTLRLKSGTTVYVDGGAWVQATLIADGVENVRVYGRGTVRPTGRGAGVEIRRSRNVEADGIVLSQIPTGQSDGVKITNVKSMTHYGWGDGMNVFASSNVHYDGVFCRNSDDCNTVYATRKGYVGGCKNILMENSTLWADVAHPIMIGLHGAATEIGVDAPSDTIQNLTYRNLDILDQMELQKDYQGVFAISCGDNNIVRDVTFDNIRVEDFRCGQLVNVRIFMNEKYCKAPGKSVDNVLFKDVTYTGRNASTSIICGYDDDRQVAGLTFENLTVNGVKITDDMPGKPKWYKAGDMCDIYIGNHVRNVVFK